MVEDSGVDELLRQWAAERSDDAELQEVNRIKDAWLAEAPPSAPGIPVQRANGRYYTQTPKANVAPGGDRAKCGAAKSKTIKV